MRHHGKESTKHYEPESENTVTELIERKVIAAVDKPTTWCSLAFFVLEADGKRVRFVTDFTALNKFVRRPTHPFPLCRTHTWTYSCFTHGTSMGTIHLSRNLADAHTWHAGH